MAEDNLKLSILLPLPPLSAAIAGVSPHSWFYLVLELKPGHTRQAFSLTDTSLAVFCVEYACVHSCIV